MPKSKIGGLEISDNYLRYILLAENNRILTAISLNLPPETISGGKIKNAGNFEAALKELNSRIKKFIKFPKNELIELIVSIPGSAIYASNLELPQLKDKELKEAIALNLKLASPIPLESSCYDWKEFSPKNAKKINIICAFAEKNIIAFLDELLKKCGFMAAAIEFSELSLLRAITTYYPPAAKEPHLLAHISQNGIDIVVGQNRQLIFNYFYEWKDEEKLDLNVANIAKILKSEIQKTINYYSSRFLAPTLNSNNNAALDQAPLNIILSGEKIDIKFLIGISEILKHAIPNKIIAPIKKGDYIIALGAALRGKIPRLKDSEITLATVKIEEKYKIAQTESLINFWSKIINFTIIFFIIIYLSTDYFLIKREQIKINGSEYLNLKKSEGEKIATAVNLSQKIKKTNTAIKITIKAQESTTNPATVLKILSQIAAKFSISILNANIESADKPLSITGTAPNQEMISKFKDVLSKSHHFEKIDLPIANLTEIERKIQFKMIIYVKNWSPSMP